MSKVDESLELITAIPDATERALMLGGLISSLMKMKGVQPVIVGPTAFECYSNAENGRGELYLSIHTGKINPRFSQDIFNDQLKGKGVLSEWKVAEITVKLEEDFVCENRELCRDFNTDYGVVKLMPAEDLTAARLWAASPPHRDPVAREEAKLMLYCALAEAFTMDWTALENLCNSPAFQVVGLLEELKAEAQEELTSALAEEKQQSGTAG